MHILRPLLRDWITGTITALILFLVYIFILSILLFLPQLFTGMHILSKASDGVWSTTAFGQMIFWMLLFQ